MNTFIGALSFEPRMLSGAGHFIETAPLGSQVVLLDYGGSATRSSEGSRLKSVHFETLARHCADKGVALKRMQCSAYSSRDLGRIFKELGNGDWIVDVSCFTRVHVVACAVLLAEMQDRHWSVVYTIPDSYGSLDDSHATGGWRDTLILPLGPDTSFKNQGQALGLILWGGEPVRLQLALDEIQPGAGRIVVTKTEGRPDFHRRSLNDGQDVLSTLLSLQFSGQDQGRLQDILESDGYELEGISLGETAQGLGPVIGTLVESAASFSKGAPIVLFPFGPKLTIFSACLLLSRAYGNKSWVVIPIHRSHGVDYSAGSWRSISISGEVFEQVASSIRVPTW